MNSFIDFLTRMWMFPQNILGLLVLLRFYGKSRFYQDYKECAVHLVQSEAFSGVSLGRTIILNEKYTLDQKNLNTSIAHEYGHYLQGKWFGPLYLIIVGIPSITMNILSYALYMNGKKKMAENYYKRWPENQADKLGGVVR